MLITIPSSLTIGNGFCLFMTYVNVRSVPVSCNVNSNIVTISTMFLASPGYYDPNVNSYFEFTLSKSVTNPNVAMDSGYFTIELYQTGSPNILIESINTNNIYEIVYSLLTISITSLSSWTTNANSVQYVFDI